jgi:hypothetical protein
MDFSFSSIIAGLLFSVVGWWAFREGKNRTNIPVTVLGIVLMIYPLFTTDAMSTWLVGAGLCGLIYYFWERG